MADKKRSVVVDPRVAERRRSLIIRISAAVALIAIAIGLGLWAILSNQSSTGSGAKVSVATASHAFRVTKAPPKTTPPAVLTVVEDFQCPACRQFETQFGSVMAELRNNPKVAVDYTPIAFLDSKSTTHYSTRAANASACVAESTAKNGDFSIWQKFHDALYAQQPEEDSAGLPNEQLNSIANQAGAQNVRQCIDNEQYKSWVAETTSMTAADHTPTLKLNGKELQLSTPDALRDAVLAATR